MTYKEKVLKLVNNPFIQGSMLYTGASFLTSILNYFFNISVGRILGPVGYGEITALFSYIVILSVPISVITTIIIQKIGDREKDNATYTSALETWFLKKMSDKWYLFVLPLLLIPFIPRITNLTPIVGYSLIPLVLLAFIAGFYDGALQGLHMFMAFSVIGILVVVIKLLGVVITFGSFSTIDIIIFFLILSGIAKLAISKIAFNQKKQNSDQTPNKKIMHLLSDKQLWYTTLSLLSVNILNNGDVIFAKKFLSAYDAGIYSSWSLFAKIFFYAVGPILSVSFIFFTNKKEQTKHKKVLYISIVGLIISSIIGYIIYTYFSSLVIGLFFGNRFNKVIPYLSSASIFGALYVALLYFNNYYLAKKSIYSLNLTFLMPFYLIGLLLIPKNLSAIINLNIIFSLVVIAGYGIVYLITVVRKKTAIHL